MEVASYEIWLLIIRFLVVIFLSLILKFNFNLKGCEEEKYYFCSSDADILVCKFWIDFYVFNSIVKGVLFSNIGLSWWLKLLFLESPQ